MKIFDHTSFTEMAWKNGGGKTTELFRHTVSGTGNFLLRISLAKVEKNGPFSIFEGIDRHLLILNGQGCRLQMNNSSLKLTTDSSAFSFPGEHNIQCELIQGPVTDFNVMIDRSWGNARVEKKTFNEKNHFINKADLAFLYSLEKHELILLEKQESVGIEKGTWISTLITVFNE